MRHVLKRAHNPDGTMLEAIPSMAGVHLSGVIRGVLPPGVDKGHTLDGYD